MYGHVPDGGTEYLCVHLTLHSVGVTKR